MAAQTLSEKILGKIQKRKDGCWIWQGYVNDSGYGSSSMGSRSDGSLINTTAHRVSYTAFKGNIPEGLQVDHLCKVRSCVNPDHLEAVTAKENIARSNSSSKQQSARTECPQGHKYDVVNTYIRKLWNGSTGRQCKECARARCRIYSARRRALARMA